MGTTPIGTSSPPSLCEGLPLLPAVGQLRAGIASTSSSNPILDISSTILFSRLKVSAYYQFLFGLCGPALAFLFQGVQYDVFPDSGTIQFTFPSSSTVESGGFVGMDVGGGVNLNVQIWTPDKWYSPWKGHWQNALNQSLYFSIDFINLLADLVEYLLQEGAADGLFNKDDANSLGHAVGLASTYSASGSTTSPLLPNNNLQVTSSITLPINFATYSPSLEALTNLLKTVKGSLSFGPAITFSFPSNLSLKNFTIEGGQGQGSTATYNITNITGDTVTAVGPAFTSGGTVSRLGTNITYSGGFDVTLSLYFTITACKIFNFSVSVPALNLTRLLGLLPPTGDLYTLNGTVESEPSGSCVLAPAMNIRFVQGGGNPTQTVTAYEPVSIQVVLGQSTAVASTVSLDITPAAPGFPASLSIAAGGTNSNTVNYTFTNTCVTTGDANNADTPAPAIPTAFTQTYQVTATLTPQPENSCVVFTNTASLNVNNNYPLLQWINIPGSQPGASPSWGPGQGATINADPSQPPTNAGNSVSIGVIIGQGTTATEAGPLTLTLLDEQRVSHTGSDVSVQLAVGDQMWTLQLNPSQTVMVTLANDRGAEIVLRWLSSGAPQGYSNRFFLIVDGGCLFGQNEFWLDVWNWS